MSSAAIGKAAAWWAHRDGPLAQGPRPHRALKFSSPRSPVSGNDGNGPTAGAGGERSVRPAVFQHTAGEAGWARRKRPGWKWTAGPHLGEEWPWGLRGQRPMSERPQEEEFSASGGVFISEMREKETADGKKKSKNQAEPQGCSQGRRESTQECREGCGQRARSTEKNASQFSSEDGRNRREGAGGQDAASGQRPRNPVHRDVRLCPASPGGSP